MTEAYIEGFCKMAEACGVNPEALLKKEALAPSSTTLRVALRALKGTWPAAGRKHAFSQLFGLRNPRGLAVPVRGNKTLKLINQKMLDPSLRQPQLRDALRAVKAQELLGINRSRMDALEAAMRDNAHFSEMQGGNREVFERLMDILRSREANLNFASRNSALRGQYVKATYDGPAIDWSTLRNAVATMGIH